MEKLKPVKRCPFCNNEDNLEVETKSYRLVYVIDKYYVKCWDCKATGPEKDTEEQAIDAWNKRS